MSCSRSVAVVVAVIAALSSTGCGRAHLYYDARELRHPAFEPKDEAALSAAVADTLAGRRLVWVDGGGRERAIVVDGPTSLRPLGLAELGAVWIVLSLGERGGEHDLRVRVAKRGTTPVTVLSDLDGGLRVITGRAEQPDAPAPTEDEIVKRHGIRALPGSWGERERRALDEALASLHDDELDVVRSLRFVRLPKGQAPEQAAVYEQKGCTATISLFSSGIGSDRFRFVGDADNARSAALHAIVHEIGHAFEKAASRQRYCRSDDARGEAKARLIHEGNALADDNPVLRAYLDVLGGLPAPTDYGTTSATESFAESFALFHVDPAALVRTRPKVAAWFAAGGHRKALRTASLSS
jgi:hypothetical protein